MYFLLLLLLGQSKLYCFYFSEFEVIFITYLYGQFLLLLKEISSKTYSLLWETFFFFLLEFLLEFSPYPWNSENIKHF